MFIDIFILMAMAMVNQQKLVNECDHSSFSISLTGIQCVRLVRHCQSACTCRLLCLTVARP
jgi:hypothetical protein